MKGGVVISILCCLLQVQIFAQSQISVSGQVYDIKNGEYLIGANIIDVYTGKGTITNSYGFFSITASGKDTIHLLVSFLGYQAESVTVLQGHDSLLKVYLTPTNIMLDDVTITAGIKIQNEVQMGLSRLSNNQIKSLPALGGEVDLLKAYQTMPGVTQGAEGSSAFFVRGGAHDQNLILLDDIPLYYVNHLGGFVSVFNSDIIKESKIIKGGFPARYGNRLSSVLDVRMKDGNSRSLHGSTTIGMISSKIALEGPIKDESTTYIFSARRFMWDLFYMLPLSGIINEGDLYTGYSFYDINAKIKHKFSDSDIIFGSFYVGDDHIREVNLSMENAKFLSSKNWGNLLGTVRWNHLFNSKLFSNTTLAFTRFRYKSFSENEYEENEIKHEYYYTLYSGIKDLNAKTDFEYSPLNNFRLNAGGGVIWHHFEPGATSYKEERFNNILIDTTLHEQKLQSVEAFLYAENRIDLGEKLSLNLGIRLTAYFLTDQQYYSFEPRLSSRYLITTDLSFKFAFATISQNVHLLDYPNSGLQNTDLWVPTMSNIKPETSDQYSVGLAYTIPKKLYEFTIEGYYKTMSNLIALKQGFSISTGINWKDNIIHNGTGSSYGMEFMTAKRQGKMQGWIAYTYSKSTRQFNELNLGLPFKFRYDRPHTINVNLSYNTSKRFSMSATWIYQTGLPITLSDGYIQSPDFNYSFEKKYNSNNQPYRIEVFSEINNYRMRNYHRLDIGLQHSKEKKRGIRIWNLSIYNTYNRMNPYYYYWKYEYEDGKSVRKLYQKSLFPFMPSMSYSFQF